MNFSPEFFLKGLPQRRNPEPHNGVARELFAADLLAVSSGNLTLEHEELEKELLRIGEHLGLRGEQIDRVHAASVKKQLEATVVRVQGTG